MAPSTCPWSSVKMRHHRRSSLMGGKRTQGVPGNFLPWVQYFCRKCEDLKGKTSRYKPPCNCWNHKKTSLNSKTHKTLPKMQLHCDLIPPTFIPSTGALAAPRCSRLGGKHHAVYQTTPANPTTKPGPHHSDPYSSHPCPYVDQTGAVRLSGLVQGEINCKKNPNRGENLVFQKSKNFSFSKKKEQPWIAGQSQPIPVV